MTAEELAAARALADAATPGPWTIDEGSRFRGAVSATIGGIRRQVAGADGQAASFDMRTDTSKVLEANAAFIAAARELVTRLIDEVEWLIKEWGLLHLANEMGNAMMSEYRETIESLTKERDAFAAQAAEYQRAVNEAEIKADEIHASRVAVADRQAAVRALLPTETERQHLIHHCHARKSMGVTTPVEAYLMRLLSEKGLS